MAQNVTSPHEFFGFQLGTDRKIAHWNQIVDYFRLLHKESQKLKVVEMGPSTEGNPFLLVIISSPKNLDNLQHLRDLNAKISDPRGLSGTEVSHLANEGKVVICQSMGLHASEIGSTQMAPELAYDLITSSTEETKRILDNTIFLFFPCLNPDGQIMVTDWYNKYLDTEYEGCELPCLYHKYAGHDNNRDAFMTNLIESKYVAQTLFLEWHPQVFQDHHEMGSYGARLYVAPYCEPIHPHADPLIWREISWYGAHMAYKLEESGITGVLNAALFPAWSHLGFHWLGNYHNIASLLTESAHTNLATPLYIHPHQLKGKGGVLRGFPHYKLQTNFPHPWEGGWWRLRDIVEQQKISALGLLDLAARHKDTILWNSYLKAKRQIERGNKNELATCLIRHTQHDSLTVTKLIDKLLGQGIEIHQASKEFISDGITYPSKTYVLFLDQPKMGVIKTLLDRTIFPDDARTRRMDKIPDRPYDTATDTIAEFMGVEVEHTGGVKRDATTFKLITKAENITSQLLVDQSKIGYILDSRLNDSFRCINQLLKQDVSVTRYSQEINVDGISFPPGAFKVEAQPIDLIKAAAQNSEICLHSLEKNMPISQIPVKQLRLGVYRRFRGGNMDEGWTRLVLEQFGFPHQALKDQEIKDGNLRRNLDVIILPSDSTSMIIGPQEGDNSQDVDIPPEYRSGIAKKGVKAIRQFVLDGGVLIAFNHASEFAIEQLGLEVKDILYGKSADEFFCPGSTLRAHVNVCHQLGYGMPAGGVIFAWDSPAFEILPSRFNHKYEVIVEYPEKNLLQSGWLNGEELLSKKAALVSVKYGDGRVILFGFRPQHRAQTHGTFKLLFNALV